MLQQSQVIHRLSRDIFRGKNYRKYGGNSVVGLNQFKGDLAVLQRVKRRTRWFELRLSLKSDEESMSGLMS